MDAHHRLWNLQHQQLQQALRNANRHDEVMRLFLSQHAMVHSAAMAQDGSWSFEDEVLAGVSDAQMRRRPDGESLSLIWLLWHMARTEDVTMNLLLVGRPQVLTEGNWADRLRIPRRDIGTSMGDTEVDEVSALLDIATVRAYRRAVGQRTRENVQTLTAANLRQPVEPSRVQQVIAEDALAQGALGLATYWGTRQKRGLLTMPATRHNFTHLNHASRIRKALRV